MKTCRYCLNPAVLLKAGDDEPCRRDVAGFPGYQIACDGTVWSCRNSGKRASWRPLKPTLSKSGPPFYQYVSLYRNKARGLKRYIHQLVLTAFVGPRPQGLDGCHNDGNSLNNAAGNLRWDTKKGNHADTVAHGTIARGADFPQAKLTDENVRTIRSRHAAGEPARLLAVEYGISKSSIFRTLNGEAWGHVQ